MGKPSKFRYQRLLKRNLANCLDAFLFIAEYPRKGNSVLSEPAIIFDGENIAVLAAFNETREEILKIVSALSNAGYSVLVIRNMDGLEKHVENIGIHKIVNRKNLGFDIGAYRDAFELIESPSNIIFLNTSLLWDAEKLTKIASKLRTSNVKNTVTYLTESLQGGKHGQSFFLHLKLDPPSIEDFETFMKLKTKNWQYKRSAVKYGEKAIFNYFDRNESVRINFVFPYSSVKKTYIDLDTEFTEDWIVRLIKLNVFLNPTQHLWPALEALGFPGYKKTLLLRNPAKLDKLPKVKFEQA